MAGCDNCYYKSPKVGSKGPEDSPYVIVGESPGINEVVEGLPFVGPSGVVIHETLKKMGWVSGVDPEPYFTNAIHCLPRQKAPENVRAACEACNPRLLEELKRYPRKVILSLGGPAIQALTGNYDLKITRERGKLFKSNLAEIGIVAAVHPAFLLRGNGNYTQFERDIKYSLNLLREGEGARKLPNGTTYDLISTPKQVTEFIGDVVNRLEPGQQMANDIETTGFNFMTDRLLYIGCQYSPSRSVIIPGELIVDELFQRSDIDYNWHNGKFDCRFLRAKGFKSARTDEDTLLLSYALNERRGIHDLDQAASDWLGSVNHKHMVDYIYKTWILDPESGLKRRGTLADLDQELVQRYLALDLSDTYHLKETLGPQVYSDPSLCKFYYNHLIPGSEYLTKLELNGMLVSEEWVMRNYYRLKDECDKYESELNGIAEEVLGWTINPRSWQQVKKLLYNGLKLAPDSWATDDDTLEKLLAEHKGKAESKLGVKAVKALQGYRLNQKAKSTYVHPLMWGPNRALLVDAKGKPTKKETAVFPDGRTHSNYLLHGTPTSRLACRDINVQNIPRDHLMRGQFCARPGYMIIECDYSQAELRSLAALSKCKDLMEIFLSGRDLHVEFSKYLFGEHFTKEEKMAAKTVNFGIPYGREAPSIAADPDLNKKMDVTVQLAQSWIDGWAERFPGAWKFIEECSLAPLRGQTIVTCFGNKKRPGVVSREKLRDLQNESRNFPHQSIASNLTLRAGMELIDPLREDYDTHIINTVHDCIVAEVPMNLPHIYRVAKFIQTKMEEIPTRFKALQIVPFKSSAEIGHHWGNMLDLKELKGLDTYDLMGLSRYVPAH